MSRSRNLASRCRQCCSSARTWVGVAAGSRDQSGSLFNTAASVSDTVSPSKARVPVSSSYITQPNAQMSARLSTTRPRTCSGDM
jgi:hypothetical protein